MKHILAPFVLLALTACVAAPTGPGQQQPVPEPMPDTCGATPLAGLVGQDATALERELILRPVRVIRPDMAITMDFSPDRINFDIDGANRITRIWCG